jgi:putative nucleotidyltransferase with HDIG domain
MKREHFTKLIQGLFETDRFVRWALLAGVTLVFIVVLYPSLVITRHVYKLGDVAERDIKAPQDFFIEDPVATDANRRQAVDEVLTVYDYDTRMAGAIGKNVRQTFSDFRSIVQTTRRARMEDRLEAPDFYPPLPNAKVAEAMDEIWSRRAEFEERLHVPVSDEAYRILVGASFSANIADLIVKILTEILYNGVVANKDLLLKEADRGIVLRSVETKTEKVIHNLKRYYGLDQAKTMVRVVGQPILKDQRHTVVNVVVDLVQGLIQPNITLNRSETEERKKQAANEIKPVLYKIKTGEMLLREGERVTDMQLLKLRTLQSQIHDEQAMTTGVGAAMIVICLLIICYVIVFQLDAHFALDLNRNLTFMAATLVSFLFMARLSAGLTGAVLQTMPFSVSVTSIPYGIPLAAAAMTVCLFLGMRIALSFALALAICTGIIFGNRFELFTYFMLNGAMGAYWIRDCKERKVFIRAGLKLGVLNVLLTSALTAYCGDFPWNELLWAVTFAFLGGIGAGVVTAGLAPLVEIAFGYTTDITLLELANLEQPILRRLMIEAPGTYHHSMLVGSLVEAAAAEIGANSLLAKVCAYYHDIGKIKQPLYFIENQGGGKNRHDKLAPSMSSLILIAHVKNGVEMARENKLGRVIIDTIGQHHGTSLIRFFYEKAKQLKGEDAVQIDDYRYPGPLPQTREAGLVMLADVVEAASRTLDNPTPSRIQGLVQNLINKIFSDGQLDHCELTLKDLHKIAKSFNKMLYGIHHHRIEYVENAAGNGKSRDGNTDRQPPKAPDSPGKSAENGSGRLKRLGLS